MSRHCSKLKASVLLAHLTVSFVACFSLLGALGVHERALAVYSAQPKPMVFYLHYTDTPVHVAGLDSKYILNTTQFFKFSTQAEAYSNSFYKPIGQPKIAVDFYLYPNLAGPVTIDGSWQALVWINASAYKPAGFNMEFREIDAGGTTIWDSGTLSPTVTSSIGGYIDIPVLNYNLSSTLTHTFAAGSTIQVEVTVNAGSSADTRIWYDSPYFPSKVILPLEDYAHPVAVKTFDINYTEMNTYSVLWNATQRQVIVQTNVTDPLGGYDVYMVNITILDPAARKVVDNANMTRMTDGLWQTRYSDIYETRWSYPDTAVPGNYSIEISVIDNNGRYQLMSYGTFEPFIEYASQGFSMGVQYPVLLRVVDAHGQTMANADVQAISGEVTLAEGVTNSSGWWKTSLWAGNYNITVSWYATEVARQPIQVTNASQYTIQCQVYYPSFKIVDDTSQALAQAEVYLRVPNGTVIVPAVYTDANGVINLTQSPGGTYELVISWKSVNVQDTTILVNSDGPYTLKTRVYQLVVNVLGNDGTPIENAYVVIYTQSGPGYGLELSNASGQAVFRVPQGTYQIDVRFSSVYWLTAVASNATESLAVSSSTSTNVTLKDYPPPIWATTQFWLLVGIAIATAIIVLVLWLAIRRKRS
jgi:hypothetical protein